METVTQIEDQLIQPEIICPLPAGTVDKAYNLQDDKDRRKLQNIRQEQHYPVHRETRE